MPVVLPPLGDAEAFLDRLDGICLSGGPDLDPEAYGATERHAELGPTEPSLDAFELALLAGAPTRAGADPRHLPRRAGAERRPRRHAAPARARATGRPSRPRRPRTPCESRRARALAALVGDAPLRVNSFHHQAIDVLGRGLRAVARAADGTIEAVEAAGGRLRARRPVARRGAGARAAPPGAVRGAGRRCRRRGARSARRVDLGKLRLGRAAWDRPRREIGGLCWERVAMRPQSSTDARRSEPGLGTPPMRATGAAGDHASHVAPAPQRRTLDPALQRHPHRPRRRRLRDRAPRPQPDDRQAAGADRALRVGPGRRRGARLRAA